MLAGISDMLKKIGQSVHPHFSPNLVEIVHSYTLKCDSKVSFVVSESGGSLLIDCDDYMIFSVLS